MSEEAISFEELTAQLAQRDVVINSMKEKTKEKLNLDQEAFITSLKESHNKDILEVEERANTYKLKLEEKTKELNICSSELNDLKELIPSLNKRLEQRKNESEGLKQKVTATVNTIEQLEQNISSLQKELAQSNLRCKRLEEERAGLAENSSESINQLLLEREKADREIATVQQALAELTLENSRLASKLKQTTDENEEAQESRDELSVRLEESRQQIIKLQGELERNENERSKMAGEGAGEIIAMRADLEAKVALVNTLKSDNAELQNQIRKLEIKITNLERKSVELLTLRDECLTNVKTKDDQMLAMQKSIDERESNGRLQLSQARQKNQDAMAEIESLRSTLKMKIAEYDVQKSATDAANFSAQSIQEKYSAIKNELEQANASLQSEIAQNQDRKKKVRDYINTVSGEKTALEAKLKEWESQCEALIEAQRVQEEKYDELQKVVADKDSQLADNELIQNELRCEIDNMQNIVLTHSSGTEAQIQEANKQLQATKDELESYRAKRMAARTEMIGMAQALERAQKEGEGLKNYLQTVISPLVFEQISYLEGLVTSVELSSHQIATKKMFRIQSSFADICQRLCLNSNQQREHPKTIPPNNSSIVVENSLLAKSIEHSPRGVDKSAAGMFGGRQGNAASRRGPGTSTIAAPTGTALAAITAVAEAHEQAEALRLELDRVKSGLTLLVQSMDKLQDVVRSDTRCCGGVFDLLSLSVGPTVRVTGGPSSYRGGRSGYDRVQGFADNYGDDSSRSNHFGLADSSHSSSDNGNGGSSILTLPTRMAGRSGGGSGLASHDANKFTIESNDDDDDNLE